MGDYGWMKLFWNERGEAGAPQGAAGGEGGTQGGEGGTQQQAQDVITKLSPETITAIEQATGKSAAEAVAKALEAKKADGEPDPKDEPAAGEVPAWLAPMLKPMLDQAQAASFQAQAAADGTEFYARHPEALKYRGEIDNQFVDFAKAGRPTFREDIYRWMTGEGGVLQERIAADRTAAAKDAETRAAAAVTAGAGASRVVEPPKAVEDMTDQELSTFMADKVF